MLVPEPNPRPLPPHGQTDKLELLGAALDQPVVLAYGRHLVGGNVVFEHENTDQSVTLFLALGEGEWDGPERVWVNGLELDLADTAQFHFHPGTEGELGVETAPASANQKICSFYPQPFVPRLTFSRTAYAAFNLRRDPTAPGPEFDLRGVYRTLKLRAFDAAGAQTAYAYSSNPAWVALDLLLRRFLLPHGRVNDALPAAVTDRLDFPAWKDWADFCDADLTINGQVVNRFESHVAFVDATDLLRALEWLLLLGRAFLLERNGKFAPFADQPRSSALTVGAGEIAADSLQLARRSLRAAANQFVFRYRALDSGVACNDPTADFQPQVKQLDDEDHQDRVGRILRAQVDLGNSTGERAERLAAYQLRRTLRLSRTAGFQLLPGVASAVDLLPGDVLTAPAALDFSSTRDYEILEITDEPDGSRRVSALEYDPAVFVDTAGPQQQLATCPHPGGGFAPNAPRLRNLVQNASFYRAGVGGQEGADRPHYWKEYSNVGGVPTVPGDVEHLLADDRVVLHTAAPGVDKIGLRTLWKNLGRLFKPGQYVVAAVSLRHNAASGTYDRDVKFKLDANNETYTQADGTKFDALIPAGTLGNLFVIRYAIFALRADQPVPDALNLFLWSNATPASPANADLEVDFFTLAAGRLWQPFDPLDEIRDADITWDGAAGLYSLPGYVVKDTAAASDSGGAGETGSTAGTGTNDFGDGRIRPVFF